MLSKREKSKKKEFDGRTTRRLAETKLNFRRGATLVGVQNKNRSLELERIAQRKARRKKRVLIWAVLGILTTLLLLWTMRGVASVHEEYLATEKKAAELAVAQVTVEISDENAAGNISERVKEFVGRLERDLNSYGIQIERVVLPFRKTREVDVYVQGKSEYYKLNIDRGSAVQAEDIFRLQRYLEAQKLSPSYVDIRVEGRAFYK